MYTSRALNASHPRGKFPAGTTRPRQNHHRQHYLHLLVLLLWPGYRYAPRHTMALPLPPGLTPNEVGFLCEMELVTVIPRQRLEGLELLGVSENLPRPRHKRRSITNAYNSLPSLSRARQNASTPHFQPNSPSGSPSSSNAKNAQTSPLHPGSPPPLSNPSSISKPTPFSPAPSLPAPTSHHHPPQNPPTRTTNPPIFSTSTPPTPGKQEVLLFSPTAIPNERNQTLYPIIGTS